MFSYQYQQCLSSSPPPSPKTYPSSTFFPFSPPTFLNEGLHDLLLASTLLPTPNAPPSDPPSPPKPPAASPPPARTNSQSASGSNTRKRAMRKDRHSKIFTAQGPRDRRMRLSLEVAREFFDLQDMLGFDKASKTVKWLLTMSSTAIKDLATTTSRPRDHLFSESSTSECENISTVSDSKAKGQVQKPNPTSKAKRVATGRVSRKPAALRPVLAKETRAMARARARERTREKKMSLHQGLQGDINGHEASHHAASSIPLDTIGDESGSHEHMSSLEPPPPAAPMEERCSSQHRQFPGGIINHNLENNHNFTGNNDTLSWFREHCELNLLVNVQGRLLNDAQQQSQLYQHLAYL